MLTVKTSLAKKPICSKGDQVLIGSGPLNSLVTNGTAESVAVLKYIAGQWFLRLRDKDATIENIKERRSYLKIGTQQVLIQAPSYTLKLEISISNNASINTFTKVPPFQLSQGQPVFPGRDKLIVGSASDADIQINDISVELRHAVISRNQNNVWTISDQGSATGTFVDGQGVTYAPLAPHSIVTIGGVTLVWPGDFRIRGPVILKRSGFARPLLLFSGVTVGYPGKEQAALSNVELSFQPGTLTAIIGPSGAGKSTLCRAVLGEVETRAGKIIIDGSRHGNGAAPNPQHVSFVPQDTCLMERLTVRQTIEFATNIRAAKTRSRNQRKQDAAHVIETLGISNLADRTVSRLSGGEKKRVSIAQELVTQPLILLLDEPSSGLDEGLDRNLMQELRSIAKSSPDAPAVIVVTHATNHLDIADNVCAIGASVSIPEAAQSEIRYMGPPNQFLTGLHSKSFSDAMDLLRSSSGHESSKHIAITFNQHFKSQGGLHPLKSLISREWMIARPQLKRSLVGILARSTIIAGLLWICNHNGLGTQRMGDNPNLLVTISLLVFVLSFWSLYKPTMRVVSDWPITRREQRWGICARLHIWARFLWDLPELLITVALTTLLLIWFTAASGPNLSIAAVWNIISTLWYACICCYLIGLLVGAASKTPIGAIGLIVGIIIAMIVFSGIIIYLPDVKFLDLISNLSPTRLTISILASKLNLAQARGSNSMLDPMFYSSVAEQSLMLLGITIISILAFIGAALSTTFTMRKLDRGN